MVTPVKDFFKKTCILSFVVFSWKWSSWIDLMYCSIQGINTREVVSLILTSQEAIICNHMTQIFRETSKNLSKDRLIPYHDVKQIAMIIRRSAFSSDHSIFREIIHHFSDSWKEYFRCIWWKKESEWLIHVKNDDLNEPPRYIWKTFLHYIVGFFLIISLGLNGIWSFNLIVLDFFCWKSILWRTVLLHESLSIA